MAREVDPGSPEQQAMEAMREAVRKIDAEREYIQNRPGPNEALDKLLEHPADPGALRDAIEALEEPPCGNGPGCDCPFHAMHEIELRQHRRALADKDGWSYAPGECTGCGLDDQPVKGPPGAELCRFCDQLRILPPPVPPVPGWPADLREAMKVIAREMWHGVVDGTRSARFGWAVWALGMILLLDGHPLPAVICFGVMLAVGMQHRP